ncbi:MAG TPA: zinc carboxypeptidase, partial [Chitinophagaceae bacterium]|nr:zinc carboxypeptidase [Chitinophagaceae bacterium]
AYAVKEKLAVSAYSSSWVNNTLSPAAYGYLVAYHSFADASFLAALLKAKFKVRFAEKEFSFNGKQFAKGTIIVLKKGNEDRLQQFVDLASAHHASVTEVSGGFVESGFDFGSEKVHLIKKPGVILLTGKGVNANAAGEVWHLFDQQLDYPVTLINAEDVDAGDLKNADVLILPDGNYKFLQNKDAGAAIKNWVQQGGKIIAFDNAAAQIARADWGFKSKKEDDDKKKDDKKDDKDAYADIKRYENRERDWIGNNIPGAIYKVELDNSHPLAFGYGSTYFTLKMSDEIYEFMKGGWNVGVIKKESQAAGFVGNRLQEKIKDGTVIGVQPLGSGSIVFFADDPIFRNFWENGKLMLANAVFLVNQ